MAKKYKRLETLRLLAPLADNNERILFLQQIQLCAHITGILHDRLARSTFRTLALTLCSGHSPATWTCGYCFHWKKLLQPSRQLFFANLFILLDSCAMPAMHFSAICINNSKTNCEMAAHIAMPKKKFSICIK